MENPKCRLCGCEYWNHVFKLEYSEYEDGTHASVRPAIEPIRNWPHQCAKCGAIMTIDYESGNVHYDLSARSGNIDREALFEEVMKRIHVSMRVVGRY